MPTQEELRSLLAGIRGVHPGSSYPTKEEIMDGTPTHKASVIAMVKLWKKEIWFPLRATEPTDEQKFRALKTLLERIATECYQKPVEVDYQPDVPSCMYQPSNNRITINSSLSILSSLHELSHHLFGASEHKACRWSVHLFKKTFPKAYSQLEWKGHTLVKPVCSVS